MTAKVAVIYYSATGTVYRAREVTGDEKALWWRRAVDAYPGYADYQRKIDRQIPVFVLESVSRNHSPEGAHRD